MCVSVQGCVCVLGCVCMSALADDVSFLFSTTITANLIGPIEDNFQF